MLFHIQPPQWDIATHMQIYSRRESMLPIVRGAGDFLLMSQWCLNLQILPQGG